MPKGYYGNIGITWWSSVGSNIGIYTWGIDWGKRNRWVFRIVAIALW